MPYNKNFESTLYDPAWLRREYEGNQRNAAQIAEQLGCERTAVLARLRRYGIKVRSIAETQRLRTDDRRGSNAPRPRKKYLATLSDPEWLQQQYVGARRSLPDLANEIGCAVPSVRQALRRAGIPTRTIAEARTGTGRAPLPDDQIGHTAFRARARRLVPKGPCSLCRAEFGRDVNHRDRDPTNNALENLERLCSRCHTQQHHEEEKVMIDRLAALGIGYREIHDEARARLRKRRGLPRRPGRMVKSPA
jgi:5-methylcytosine-specific restriction endonuclease McrA